MTLSPSNIIAHSYNTASKICSNIISSIDILVTVSGNNSNYKVDSVTVGNITQTQTLDFSTQNVQGYFFSATVKLVKSGANARSGGPGYVAGKPVSIFKGDSMAGVMQLRTDIADSTGNCVANGTSISTTNLIFGQPFNVKCGVSDCNNQSYAINNLLDNTTNLWILRYGNNRITYSTKDAVQVSYAQRSNSICASTPASTTLNIVYSYSGTTSDPQLYIVSAYVSYQEQ